MKRLLWLLLIITHISYAQNQSNTWVVGNRIVLDFQQNSCKVQQNFSYSANNTIYANYGSVIGNNTRELLFYTTNGTIRNRVHESMSKGSDMERYAGTGQRDIIVPSPTDRQQYYVFRTTRRRSTTTEYLRIEDTASYNVVDMRLADGMGDIAQDTEGHLLKDIRLHPRPSSCRITATRRSACGRSYWILTHDLISNTFYAYLLDSAGVQPPVISQTGSVFSYSFVSDGQRKYTEVGCMKFSRDGTCVVAAIGSSNTVSKVEFFNFDKRTGQVSLRESIDYRSVLPYSQPVGVSFSPNDSLIYVSMINTVYQYDRYAPSLANSAIVLTTPDTNPHTYLNKYYNILQLAPNGCIYTGRGTSSLYDSIGQPIAYTRGWLSEIRYPNRRGLACALHDSVLHFRTPYFTIDLLPNCIDGDMGVGAAFLSVYAHRFCVGDTLRVQANMKGFRGDYAPQMQVWYSDSDSVLVQGYQSKHTYTQAGLYPLRVRLWQACGTTYQEFRDTVAVLPCQPPRLELSCVVADSCGQSIGRVAYSSLGGLIDSLRWDMDGDGLYESQGQATALLKESRSIVRQVGLWGMNAYGRDSVQCSLSFEPEDCSSYYFVPNVFTCNADGVNDRWELSSRGYGLERLWVYNRWGTRVHGTERVESLPSVYGLWDGGQQSAGVYFYVLELKELATGRRVQAKGTVELMR